jgi:gamma-glutamyltranspeptidase/glutathione hydrolase/leukotriene-C4 hydrolase
MVSEQGPDVVYDGELSAGLVADIQAAGGIITEEDLAGYQPVIRDPLELDVFGYHMFSSPPPSSGGSAIFAVLNYLEGYLQPFAGVGNLAYHRMAEGIKHAFAMRMNLVDPDYVDVDDVVHDMLSKEFMGGLRENSSDDTTLPLDEYGGKWNQLDDHGTTHLSIIDKWGNVVSMTSTINTAFGSKILSPSTGILLNDQMDDFSIPGSPNAYGLAPAPENYVAPGKRPLSSMSPTIVLEKGKVRMIAGASGGPMIITATTQVLVNHLLRGWDLATAVSAPRLHSQLLPDELYCEKVTLVNGFYVYLPDDVRASLAMRNHNIVDDDYLGVSQAIAIDQDTGLITAVSDYRKDGRPAPETV